MKLATLFILCFAMLAMVVSGDIIRDGLSSQELEKAWRWLNPKKVKLSDEEFVGGLELLQNLLEENSNDKRLVQYYYDRLRQMKVIQMQNADKATEERLNAEVTQMNEYMDVLIENIYKEVGKKVPKELLKKVPNQRPEPGPTIMEQVRGYISYVMGAPSNA